MQTQRIDITQLSSDPANARKHSQRNIEAIASSLRRFGQQKPIVVDKSNVVRAGNGTLEAARHLGWDQIDVVFTNLESSEATAFAIADNRTAELAEWNDDVLAASLQGLDEELQAAAGYEGKELEQILSTLDTADVVEDEVPEVPDDPTTQPGDLWLLGDHRLLCGDSTKQEDVDRLVGGVKADACVTDPPYGINANKQTLGTGKKNFYRGEEWDAKRPDLTLFINKFEQVIVWGGNYFSDSLPVTNDWLCWHKKNDGLSFSEFELAWTNLNKNCRLISHHWSGEKKQHPTQKPVAVMAWCVEMVKGLIFDPFLGSGTTLIAAEQLGRKCYGMELSPQYCDVIVERWQNLTGKEARRDGT